MLAVMAEAESTYVSSPVVITDGVVKQFGRFAALRGVSQNGRSAVTRPKRVLSVAARRRIAAAQRARWAKYKQQKKAAA